MMIKKRLQIFAALSLVEGIVALLWLIFIPTNRQAFSTSRLAGLVGIVLLLLISAVAFYYFRPHAADPFKFIDKITIFQSKLLLSFALLTIALLLWVAILFKDRWLLVISASTYIRLLPIVIYGILIFFQTGMFLVMINHEGISATSQWKSVWKPALALWGMFGLVWIFVALSHFGFIHDDVGLNWGPPGTPVSFAQLQLVVSISFIIAFGWYLFRSRLRQISFWLFPFRDLVIFLVLWALAVILWSNTPMSPTHFTPPPMPPNNETYPNSDALIFDRSSYHLLYGIGFANHLIRRPLYVGMLALFHKIAGGNYDATMFLQILVLALIPSLVYLLTSRMSNRTAGLIAGGLILLREKNSIDLSGVIVTSHAKLMMSDMVTMLGVILFLYLALLWAFKEKSNPLELIIIGACLGLTALIRTQVLILVAPLLLVMLLFKKSFKTAIKNSFFVMLGLILVIVPWLWRNWNLTGTLVLDDRGEERLLARNYSSSPFALPSPSTGETDEQFSARLKTGIFTFIRTHPGEVAHFIVNHFMRNLATSSVYVTPVYSTDSPLTIVKDLPFWNDWTGTLDSNSRLALFLNLGMISLGIGAAIAKNKWIGVFPSVGFLFYSFGNALVRSSGWRFNQPADWIILVYFGIASAYLLSQFKVWFSDHVSNPVPPQKRFFISAFFPSGFVLLVLILIGGAIPIAEKTVQARDYDSFTQDAKTYLANDKIISVAEINTFLGQENAVLVSGVALYPRYIHPNSRFRPAGMPSRYRYLHFWLINEDDNQVILPIQNAQGEIPHTTTISVIGCREKDYISALAIIVQEPSKHILIRSPQAPFVCPLSEPNSN